MKFGVLGYLATSLASWYNLQRGHFYSFLRFLGTRAEIN